jgi:hypothetical protein
MAMILASVYRAANSISEMREIPFALMALTTSFFSGMPGLMMISEALRISSRLCWPDSNAFSSS